VKSLNCLFTSLKMLRNLVFKSIF